MTPDQFRAILAAHGGLIGTELLDTSTDEEISTGSGSVKTGEKIPPARVRIKYITKDGPITAYQQDDGSYAVLDDPKSLVKGADPAGEKPKPMTEYERAQLERQAGADARSDRAADRADRTENRLITSQEAAARRQALLDQRRADIDERKMSIDEANTKFDRDYRDQVEIPLKRSAEARAIEASKREEEKAKFEREKYQQETVSAREKEQTRQREAGIKFSYDAGRDAVADAQALMPYRVGPTFGAEFAAGLGTLANGGGPISFSPGAIAFDAPDYGAIAEQAAQRAAALYSLPPPGAPAAAPAAPAAPAPVPSPAAVTGAVPPVTAANRDLYNR